MVKTYMATTAAELGSLEEHMIRHGAPPCVPNSDSMTTIAGSPGRSRLCAADNPKYYERCLGNLFHMFIECNRGSACLDWTLVLLRWSTRKQSLGRTMPKQKQMNTEHGHNCAVYMEMGSQRLTTTGSITCGRCVSGNRGTPRRNEHC